ncbi:MULTISPECIES: lysylphosphatidylglycerol synthase domain-containing protein [Nocardioides]|uniref:lysylphosphatidylglycerol synthase domain-containing protein n=1 Tax=Nocardioides TaxID=1839 RepID=UPI002867CF58|nr:lysylphosphatidylglycerol synthase domain-containing protein [Nocardioides sp. CGMCC 1.13656]
MAGAALTCVALPSVTGVAWNDVAPAATEVPPVWLIALTALWFTGLLAHTITLTGALPGLTLRRALALSLTGSAVANVLPLGGAAGIALNYRMARTWGHSPAAIGAYTVVTNIWDVGVKVLLPILALPALLVAASTVGATVANAVIAGVLGLGVLTALGVATLSSAAAARRTGNLVDRVFGRWLRGRSCRAALLRLREVTHAVIRTRWRRLSTGIVLYTALLFALLLGCLTASGAGSSFTAVLAGFTVERILTLAGLTPGGAGVVEVGLATTLLAFPGAPVGIALGVLLYRALTFGLEIPVGGVALAAWFWAARVRVKNLPSGSVA